MAYAKDIPPPPGEGQDEGIEIYSHVAFMIDGSDTLTPTLSRRERG